MFESLNLWFKSSAVEANIKIYDFTRISTSKYPNIQNFEIFRQPKFKFSNR